MNYRPEVKMMTKAVSDNQALFERVLHSFEACYNINREDPLPPFDAEASFNMHDEQYFLIRSARLSEADSREFVFFRLMDHLDLETFQDLDRKAWETCLARVDLSENHKSTDVCLILIANTIDPRAKEAVRRTDHYKSYRFGLKGWSCSRTIAYESETGACFCSRRGQDLQKLFKA